MDTYQPNPNANAVGTSLRAETPRITYARLVKVFGKPHYDAHALAPDQRGDGKISTEWDFTGPDGSVFTLYDYEETSLYSRGLPSVAKFRADRHGYNWHVGGHGDATQFLAWLMRKVRS